MPQGFELYQNFPNPFNPETTIKYKMPREGKVNITIYDSLGKKVKTLVNGNRPAGIHTVRTKLEAVSGVYFYKISFNSATENFSQIKKMLLLK